MATPRVADLAIGSGAVDPARGQADGGATPTFAVAGHARSRRISRHRPRAGGSRALAQQRDHDHDDYDQHDAAGGHAHRPLTPPELRISAITRIATLGWRPDPVLIVIKATHKPSLPT
jgi:hypothetical protein